jgi:hypothetical protein
LATVAASQETSFAVKINGTLWAWGYIDGKVDTAPRQLGTETNWLMIAAGEFEMMAFKSDGTIWRKVIYSSPSEPMTQIGRDHDWKTVDVSLLSYCAAKQDGSRWAWGFINGTNAASPERLPSGYAAWCDAPQESPRSSKFPPGTALVLTADGGLWTRGKRIGTEPGVVRWSIGSFLGPVTRRWTTLGNIFKARADETPYRLWELPAELRRSLEAAPPLAAYDLNTNVTTDAVHSDKKFR